MIFRMEFVVQISPPEQLPELIRHLVDGACVAQALDDRHCSVVHAEARDATEAREEIGFFLRCFRRCHPHVDVSVVN